MTQRNIFPATLANRKSWCTNQCVSVGCDDPSRLLVTSRQNQSTPGIYTEVYLKQHTRYCVYVTGQALANSCAFVFVYDPATKRRLIPNYTFLPTQRDDCVNAVFTSPACATEYARVHLGVLFTQPRNGQQFSLEEIRLQPIPSLDDAVVGGGGSATTPCTAPLVDSYDCAPAPAPATVHKHRSHAPHAPHAQPPAECAHTENHYHFKRNRDPYYTYHTPPFEQPCEQPCDHPRDHPHRDRPRDHSHYHVQRPVQRHHESPPTLETCCPRPAVALSSSSSSHKPAAAVCVSTKHAEPVSIADLQVSLNTMITQMK
jgi:hypothetical protein